MSEIVYRIFLYTHAFFLSSFSNVVVVVDMLRVLFLYRIEVFYAYHCLVFCCARVLVCVCPFRVFELLSACRTARTMKNDEKNKNTA